MKGGRPYDVILLGSGLSGLLAAAVLARRGRRVLVLKEADPSDTASGSPGPRDASVEGPLLLTEFEREGLYDRLFMEVGLSLATLKQEGKIFRRTDPPFQIILPGHRLNFYQKAENRMEELGREFPENLSDIRSFFNEVNQWGPLLRAYYLSNGKTPANLKDRVLRIRDDLDRKMKVAGLQRKRASGFLNRFHLDQEFFRGMEALLFLFTGLRLEEASEFELLMVMALLGRDVVGLPLGATGLSDLLAGVIQKFQGEVVSSIRIKELMFHQKTVRQIRTERETVRVEGALILNLDVSRFSGEYGGRGVLRFRFIVPEQIIPRSMKDHLVVSQSTRNPESADRSFFLSLGAVVGEGGGDGRRRILETALFCDNPSTLERDQIDRLRNSVVEQLLDLMPFAGDAIEFLGYRASPSPSDDRLSAVCGDLVRRSKRQGLLPPGYFTTPYQNLFFLPDGGIRPIVPVSEIRSAADLADRIHREGTR
jgi:hypothetical protein